MADSSFAEYVTADVFRLVPDVTRRAMFGGHGIYSRGVIFALVAGDRLYMKATDANRDEYVEAGSEPFTYDKKDGTATMTSYWSLPEEVMSDVEQAAAWAERSYDASRAAKRG